MRFADPPIDDIWVISNMYSLVDPQAPDVLGDPHVKGDPKANPGNPQANPGDP
jgi:hypothetical protein